jgi:enoyl-CoA hydratase/carnithine racemase
MTDLVLYHRQDGIVTITMNAPQTRNALFDDGIIDALADALNRLNADQEARVGILTGAGTTFSAGANLKKVAEEGGLAHRPAPRVREFYRQGIQKVPLAFNALEVPIIAAVNGPAFGAGCDIACMCDLRIAADTAQFGEVFVKLGVTPGDAGAWFIPRIIGIARYAEMAFTGEPVDAQTALAWGLVSQVVPGPDLIPEAMKLARRIAANAPLALRMTKRLVREGQQTRLETHLELCAAFMAITHKTEDHHEALDAYFAKRAPVFVGR